MPPRRKPTSTRQKKADQQLKRAIKRGDVPPLEVKKSANSRRKTGPTGRPIAGRSSDTNAVESVKKLQSTFVNLPQNFLEESKFLASNLTLLRPVPDERAVFHLFDQKEERALEILTCPKRPKWRYDQSKLEVERNEEGLFKKWLTQTDAAIERWQNSDDPKTSPMPRSTSYFERNLEVWRQLYVNMSFLVSLSTNLFIDGVSLKFLKLSSSFLTHVALCCIFRHH